MSDHDDDGYATDATTVGYTVSSKTYLYLRRMIELGAIEGSLGHMKPAEFMEKIVTAMHTVLAGGDVDIQTTDRPNPDIFRELNERVVEAAAESNAINEAAGYYVTLVP